MIVYGAAKLLEVPTPEYSLVKVPDLMAHNESLEDGSPIYPGIAFGSKILMQADESTDLKYLSDDDNERHAAEFIALWEWCDGQDEQFLYRQRDDNSLTSFDFGFWLGIEGEWNIDRYETSSVPRPWPGSLQDISRRAFLEVSQRLERITVEECLQLTSAVPIEWGFSDDELISIAKWLFSRKDRVVENLKGHARNAGRE